MCSPVTLLHFLHGCLLASILTSVSEGLSRETLVSEVGQLRPAQAGLDAIQTVVRVRHMCSPVTLLHFLHGCLLASILTSVSERVSREILVSEVGQLRFLRTRCRSTHSYKLVRFAAIFLARIFPGLIASMKHTSGI